MKPNQFKRHAVALACAILATPALAQVTVLESVIVTGPGIEADSITKPFSIITVDELNATGASTLGEALRYQPGISATGFGPNSSRPIVRGQDSDRIKILRNSAPMVDASALSFDHALPVDPFSLHQVEILRGPAALAYGGNAVGGVVNLVDQRIARTPIQGLQAETNFLIGGAADQTAAGFRLGAGLGSGFSLHLDGFRRTARDLKTPSFTDPDGFTGDRVRNSAAKADGASIGLSKQTGHGYVGFSAEQYDNLYGVPRKLDVQIGMENQRYALEGEQNITGSLLTQVKYRIGKTDYQHQEFEEGLPATQFLNDGTDARLELAFRPFSLAGLQVSSKAGLQLERSDFSAIGEEAFVPGTNTRQSGAFAIFTASPDNKDSGVFEFGLRTEQVDVDAISTGSSQATGPVAGGGVTSGPGLNRSFQPQSFSLGYTKPIGQGWSIGGSLSRVERAPSNFELYADGVHVATDAYEKGNPDLQVERGRHAEITSTWAMNRSKFSATAFTSSFSNYIALIGRSGADSLFDEDGDLLTTEDQVPVFDFRAVPARFQGIELVYSTAYPFGKGELKPFVQYDLVQGKRTDGGGNLPRISPQKISAGAAYSQQGWTIAPEVIWVDDSRPDSTDQVVDAYQLVNLRVGKNISWGKSGGEVFASLQNLTDELAFSATTLNTVRQFTPLPGRSALVGLRLAF